MKTPTLREYINSVGIKAFCEKFGVTERAATAYRYEQRRPQPTLALRIVADSPVTWEGIYLPNKG